jgi:hypothetical protein
LNRGTIRSTVLSRRSWHADVDPAFLAEVNTVCIDGATKRLASEVPEAFLPDIETVFLLGDQDQSTLARTIAATTDPYVLSFGPVGTTQNILTNGTWDGLYHLEVFDAATGTNGTALRRQCREFFIGADPVTNVATYYVTIDRPWRNSTDTGYSFRLFQPSFYLRDNVTELVDGRVFDTSRQLLVALPEGFARRTSREDYRGQNKGRPEGFTRGEYFQLAAPNRAPVAAVPAPGGALTTWVGPEPLGTFSYRYTYVWGKKNFESAAPGGSYDPVWESAPSPETASVNVPVTASSPVISALTNIDFQLGFGDASTLRYAHSGLRKRIYRARTAVTSGGGFEQNVEYPGIYFFLDEVGGEVTTYTDDGSAIPDYHRRLPESRGYYAWSSMPHQDVAYEIDLRVYRRPLALLVDSDAPPIHPDFDDMFEDLVLARLCEMDKSPEASAMYEAKYQERLLAYRAKEASPAAFVPPEPWRPGPDYRDPYRYATYRST